MRNYVIDINTTVAPPTDFAAQFTTIVDIDVNDCNEVTIRNEVNRLVRVPYAGGIILGIYDTVVIRGKEKEKLGGKLTVNFLKSSNLGRLSVCRKKYI